MSSFDASRRVELAAAILVLAFAVAGYYAVPSLVSGWAFAMPGTTDNALAPTFFPRLAMILLALAALGVIVTTRWRRAPIPLLAMERGEWRRMALVTALVLAYFGAMIVIGFILASAIFLAVTALALGYRSYGAIIATALLVPLATALAFRFGMRVLLPAGYLGVGF